MAADNFSIEVDSKFLDNLFGLVDQPKPGEVTLKELNDVVAMLKQKLNNAALSSSSSTLKPTSMSQVNPPKDNIVRPKSVLVVDDLGIITYQFEILFKKIGFETVISQEINDAIDKFKKQDFGFAVIDLFIPTEREGFILLDELKKLSLLCKLNTRIIVMTASSKPEYQTKCINRGADFFVEKTPGWQKKIIEACTG